MPYVSESLVVDRDGRLVALVYADPEAVESRKLTDAELVDAMEQNRKDLNRLVAPYEQVSAIELVSGEFAKTPKRSIKRFMYK